jgi:dihydrodipicolinate synthase/N-acetylneuraminate lyase
VTLHRIKHQIASDTSNKVCLFAQGSEALGIKCYLLPVRVTNSFPAEAVLEYFRNVATVTASNAISILQYFIFKY